MDYKEKYLKYKNKYLEFKQLSGNPTGDSNPTGRSNEKNIILVTHNGRIRCLLESIGFKIGGTRFKNCCILLLKIKRKNNKLDINSFDINLSLEYEGKLEVEKPDKKYFKKGHLFEYKNDNVKVNVKFLDSLLNCEIDIIYNYYIVRHGDGFHNSATILNGKKLFSSEITDALLTDKGIEQAKNAGKEMKKLIDLKKIEKIDYLFVSDLERTRQTMYNLLLNLIKNCVNKKIIVLQCSHELNFVEIKDGTTCDSKQGINLPVLYGSPVQIDLPVPFENKSKCVNYNDTCPTIYSYSYYDNDNDKKVDVDIEIEWKYYKDFYNDFIFYGNKTRTDSNLKCYDNNMIGESLNIIKYENDPESYIIEKKKKMNIPKQIANLQKKPW